MRSKNTSPQSYIERQSPDFFYVTLAMFSAGLATFSLLYCVQPILPLLSDEFGISPAESSLSLSLSTGMLAIGLMFTGPISDAIGRKSVMVVALLLAGSATLLCAVMQNWYSILIMRALVGLSLSGIAAVAMTYISEEIHPTLVAVSIGLYISGNSLGGMSGRLLTGIITDWFSWRVALGFLGCFSLGAAALFWRILPPSHHFRPESLRPRSLLINLRLHWHDKGLPLLFIEGFLIMGSFVAVYNYIGYRLLAAPYFFSPVIVGLISIAYLSGTYSSPKAGSLVLRFGRGKVLIVSIGIMVIGLLLTLLQNIFLLLIGVLLFTAGFFAAHSIASSWVGLRAKRAKGQASSLYLFCYYLGSSVLGTLCGIFWLNFSWNGVVACVALLLFAALFAALRLIKLPESRQVSYK